MSGYVIANIDVKNPEAYKEYIDNFLIFCLIDRNTYFWRFMDLFKQYPRL